MDNQWKSLRQRNVCTFLLVTGEGGHDWGNIVSCPLRFTGPLCWTLLNIAAKQKLGYHYWELTFVIYCFCTLVTAEINHINAPLICSALQRMEAWVKNMLLENVLLIKCPCLCGTAAFSSHNCDQCDPGSILNVIIQWVIHSIILNVQQHIWSLSRLECKPCTLRFKLTASIHFCWLQLCF